MPATLTRPVCLAPGQWRPFVAPAPDVLCHACGGLAPDLDCELPCSECNGCGLDPIAFRLPPSRSHGFRAVRWEPGRHLLTVRTARKPHLTEAVDVYSVAERPCDWPGRSFLVAKIGHMDRLHEVYVGVDVVTCSCEGHVYLSASKANQRAFEADQQTFPTYGCLHTDALAALVAGGWFPPSQGA